jgi:hypothetical protein
MRTSVFAFAVVVTSLTSGAAMAFDATGVVDVYHVNLEAAGERTGCIQFSTPGLPNGWGCVYRIGSNSLSNLNADFINSLLRDAALKGNQQCRVFWKAVDGLGSAKIFAAECRRSH